MTITHLCIVDRGGKLLLSYFLTPTAVAAQDAYEAALAEETRCFWEAAFKQDVPTGVKDACVVLRGVAPDLLFIASGRDIDDELALVEALDYAVQVVTATCDGRLTATQITAFHGKVCVCVNELFHGGMLAHTDVEAVLRAAKLKPPKV